MLVFNEISPGGVRGERFGGITATVVGLLTALAVNIQPAETAWAVVMSAVLFIASVRVIRSDKYFKGREAAWWCCNSGHR